jgi:FKBP-type peptidyl-prolyl cis-trans isomerase
MKKLPIVLIAGLLSGPVFGQNGAAPKNLPLPVPVQVGGTNAPDPAAGKFKSDLEKNSYVIGVLLGGDVKRQAGRLGLEYDPETVIKAFTEAINNRPTLVTEGEANVIIRATSVELRKKAEEKRKADGEKAKGEGLAFLEANKSKEGVKVTASGLQYKVIKEGEGAKPTTNDVVQVHYRGTLIDGTEFDSSYSRGEPASFGIGRVIKGWTEGLQLMSVGSKYQFTIPSELAYGENGTPKIGPNSVLQFDVELIGIRPQPTPPPSPVVTSDIIKVPSAEELKKGAQIEVIKASDAERIQKEAEEQKKKLQAPKN